MNIHVCMYVCINICVTLCGYKHNMHTLVMYDHFNKKNYKKSSVTNG